MFIIKYFCSNLENISSSESHDLINESCFNKQLTMFSPIDYQYFQDSKLIQVSRTLQRTLIIMSGSYHFDDIHGFGYFMIYL